MNIGPSSPERRGPGPHDWVAHYARLAESDRTAPLPPADLEQFAIAAYLTGRDAEGLDLLTRAHHAWLEAGEPARAARAAFWIGFILLNRGELAPAGGWTARARRILDEAGVDGVERGYLLLPGGIQQVIAADLRGAYATFSEAAAVGARFGDADLVTLARQAQGRALVGLGSVAEGVALLDEAMTAVTAGDVSPAITGTVYCSVISACADLYDVRRAQEWTDALDAWCEAQHGLVPYRGQCLAHRAELLALHGGWTEALDEARRASAWLESPPGNPARGAALYQVAEIHRLRGEFADAEAAYQAASDHGRTPQPGLALLRLAQGRVVAAHAAIARILTEAHDPRTRSRVLPAAVEILIASGDVDGARAAAGEFDAIARTVGTPLLRAASARASGSVRLAEGDAKGALALLGEACATWRELDAPFESARTAVLVALACRVVGDADGAAVELRSARRAFETLGAVPDVARVDELLAAASGAASTAGPLTGREIEVLRLVAAGKTNRAIADELGISEKTVARHMSNIFVKLDLPSRAAATAYAFQHHLV